MRKRRRYPSKTRMYLALAIFGLMLMLGIGCMMNMAIPVVAPVGNDTLQFFSWPQWREILALGIPGMAGTFKQEPVRIKPTWSIRELADETIKFITGIDYRDTRSLLRAQLPLLAYTKLNKPAVSAMTLPNFPRFDAHSLKPSGEPLVAIYHTHTSECFVPTSGVTHRPSGQQGDIVDVGAALAERLESHGIRVIHNTKVHDYPSFMKAYGPSEETVKQILAEYPSIQMLFDIHRDAEKRENSIALVNGTTIARMAIIVAVGQEGLEQPHWQQNHAFAKLLDARLNQYYPGLSKGIQLVEWRYNQHLHPRALLLEVGSHENSKEEAINTVRIFGDILAEIIAENQIKSGD